MTARFAENQAVLKALGLDHLKRVAAINIKLRTDQLPIVVIWQYLEERGQDEPQLQRFHLVPVVDPIGEAVERGFRDSVERHAIKGSGL